MPKPSKLDPYAHLLGQRTDAEVAALAGVTREAVRIYRTRRGIPSVRDAARTADDLPPEPGEATHGPAEDRPEPTTTPSARGHRVKRRRGDVVENVANSAAAESAPTAGTESTTRPGRKSAEELLEPFRGQLGNVDDGKIAEMAGLSRGVVGAFRRKHGIRAYDGYLWTTQRRPRSAAGADEVRRTASGTAAPASGTSPPSERKPAKPGRKSRKSGADTRAAAESSTPSMRRGPPSKIDAVRDLVGVLSDAEVAARVGLSRSAVQMYRRKHDIAAPTKRAEVSAAGSRDTDTARPSPAKGAAEAPLAATAVVTDRVVPLGAVPLIAWRVTLRLGGVEVERYAITADSSSVGRLGDAAGEVLKIERLGEGLA